MTVATQLKVGNTVILDDTLFKIIKLNHITPGKGNAVVQADLRNMKTGIKTNKRFRSSEDVEVAEVRTRKMQYLYADGDVHHFMDDENFEQYELSQDLIEEAAHYILADNHYDVSVYEGMPIDIELPARMTLKVTETDPPQKGVQGKIKPATLETGLVVKVPLFIAEGESVVVNTESGDYMERAKEG